VLAADHPGQFCGKSKIGHNNELFALDRGSCEWTGRQEDVLEPSNSLHPLGKDEIPERTAVGSGEKQAGHVHNGLCKTGGRLCIAHGHFTFWKGGRVVTGWYR